MVGNVLAIWPTPLTPSVSSVRDKHHMSSYTKDQIHWFVPHNIVHQRLQFTRINYSSSPVSIAECQQILPVRCCSDSCNHCRNMHQYTQVQQAGKDIFEHFGSLYLCSRGVSGHGLQLELVLVRTLWAQYPHHRQTNHDQLIPPPPDWQCGFGTTVWFDTWHAKH